ncbi:MAG: hypothetical protein WC858_05525 [Parcubacteria group bacterium]|jgi:hypothetical protein
MERLRYACDDEVTYKETLKEGHALLKEIHQEATKQGIEIDGALIDRPFSVTEVAEAAGYVKIRDGMVSLTKKGEEAGRAFWEGRQSPSRGCPGGLALAIKIVRTPKGPAPEEIRKEWRGMELAAERCHSLRRDFLTGGEVYCAGFAVARELALEALKEKSPEAAWWFHENLSPDCGRLIFGADEAEVVGTVVICSIEQQ